MVNYGAAILQGLGSQQQRDYQRKLLEQERARAGQANLVAALTGMATQALGSGQLLPKGGGVDLASLLSPQSLTAGVQGALQPVSGGVRDIFTGGAEGIKTAQAETARGKTQTQEKAKTAMDVYKLKKDILSKHERAKITDPNAFDAGKYFPEIFPTGTYLKPIAKASLFNFGSPGEQEDPRIAVLKALGFTDDEIAQLIKEL